MGQCYEFGVAIHPGCGHAMRVGEAGGACVCPTCGARCEGRFEACGPILEKPGYVPVTAPPWAIDCVDPPAPEQTLPRVATPGTSRAPAGQADAPRTVDPEALALVRAELGTLTSDIRADLEKALARRQRSPTPAIDNVRIELSEHDKQLVDAYDRLSESYAALSARADEDRETTRAVIEGLARVARRVGQLEKTLGTRPPT